MGLFLEETMRTIITFKNGTVETILSISLGIYFENSHFK